MNKRLFHRMVSFVLIMLLMANLFCLTKIDTVIANRTTWLVNSLDDSDDGSCDGADCTLREAINHSNSGDIINFENAIAGQTILLNSPLIIDHDLTIDNSNHKNRVIISGQDVDNIIEVNYHVSLTMEKLSLVDGHGNGGALYNDQGYVTISHCNFISNGTTNSSGGAIRNNLGTISISHSKFSENDGNNGGAIRNYGHMTITDSSFEDNIARSSGGAIYNALGSISEMSLIINNSTFSGNSTTDYDGGAIYNDSYGILQITNCTFEDNNAANRGGGIYSDSSTDLLITHSTFSGNSSDNTSYGGGVHILGSLRIYNSIIANTSSGYDCYWNYIDNPWSITNLIENNAPMPTSCGTPLSTADPLLLPLAQNGGYTKTMAILLPSPAINQGSASYCTSEDQRGVSRPQGLGCDLGSYEYQYPDLTAPVVLSITAADPNPTNATIVHFTVTFSEPVIEVDIDDFSLRDTGITGDSLGAVTGSGSVYSVTANTGTGIGTLRLDLLDDGSIFDLATNQLGGDGPNNGSFTTGEKYMLRYLSTYLPIIIR